MSCCYVVICALAIVSVVVQTCCINGSSNHRKVANFYPQRAITPEPIEVKLGFVDYVEDPTPYANFVSHHAVWVVWENAGFVQILEKFEKYFGNFQDLEKSGK